MGNSCTKCSRANSSGSKAKQHDLRTVSEEKLNSLSESPNVSAVTKDEATKDTNKLELSKQNQMETDQFKPTILRATSATLEASQQISLDESTNNNMLSVSMALPERAKITKKNRSNNSMFKSFTNFFNREQNSVGELSHGQSSYDQRTSSTSLPPVTRTTIAKLEQITPDYFQNSFINKLASKPELYSLQSLPARSQCLLTAQPDFQQYLCSSGKTTFKSGLRDVQIYVSTPTSLNNYSLCDTSLVHHLRQHVTNSECDFNLIDLDSIFAASSQGNGERKILSNSEPSRTVHKYLRRFLGSLVLQDLLNMVWGKWTTGLFLFVVFLSSDLENEGTNEELCAERIDVADFENLCSQLSGDELVLVQKWYTQQPSSQALGISPNFYQLNTRRLVEESTAGLELIHLLNILKVGLETPEKYLKTIQASEIEFVVQHIDPGAIVWLNLDNSAKAAGISTTLSLLQSHVLAHNYKEFQIDSGVLEKTSVSQLIALGFATEDSVRKASDCARRISDFLRTSLTSLVDIYVNELTKKQVTDLAPKIDKQLAHEIFTHYALHKQLSSYDKMTQKQQPATSHLASHLETQLDEYLATTSVSRPLVLLESTDDSKGIDSSLQNDSILSKYIELVLTGNKFKEIGDLKDTLVLYRFCSHTVISSDLATLTQSIAHQLSYILGVHESWSFTNPSSIAPNLVRAMQKRQEIINSGQLEQKSDIKKRFVLFLIGVDRLLKTSYDQEFLTNFLSSLYNQHSTLCFNVHIVLSFSSDSVEWQFAPIEKHFVGTFSEIDSIAKKQKKQQLSANVESLELNLIDLLNVTELTDESDKFTRELIIAVTAMIKSCRYGLKQCEITDLLLAFAKEQCKQEVSPSKIALVWLLFKHNTNLIGNQKSRGTSLTTMLDQGQVLYRLSANTRTYADFCDKKDYHIKKLINTYMSANKKKTQSVRSFQELPSLELSLTNCETLMTEYALNTQWMVEKCQKTQNVLYFMQDLQLVHQCLAANQKKGVGNNNKITRNLEQYEEHFYNLAYALHQNALQFNEQLDAYCCTVKEPTTIAATLEPIVREAQTAEFVALNLNEALNSSTSTNEIETSGWSTEKLVFNCIAPSDIFYSRVFFVNSSLIAGLSETQNEISIWQVNYSNEDTAENLSSNVLAPIRTIKLNRSPKDMRLLDEKTAAILIDRNLHLLDLNLGKHTLDMNSTMSANVPFFEVHDPNHVVLLARNRLSVILMKVCSPLPAEKIAVSITEHTAIAEEPVESPHGIESAPDLSAKSLVSTTKSFSAATKTYSKEDDMFLFKAGEDRYLNSMMVSSNGEIMVCGDEVQKPFPLLVWNLNQRKLVYDLRQYKHEFITTIQAIGASGKFMVCGCKEEAEVKNCLIVYDLSTGQMTRKLKAKVNYLSVDINEQLSVVVACLENAQIIVYDLTTGSEKNVIRSNRYPANIIKLVSTKQANYIVTYDTLGVDWTIRLWHLDQEDTLLSAFTCPSRVVSLSINSGPLHFGYEKQQNKSDVVLLAVSLYGFKELLLIKLDEKRTVNLKTESSYDPKLNGSVKEVVI